METRGVTRPMALHEGHDGGGHDMDPREMLEAHHRKTLWIPWTPVVLGIWLVVAPFSFGYLEWASWEDRSAGGPCRGW